MKINKTQRKFYGKWLYKISLDLPGCALFRTMDLLSVIAFCDRRSSHELLSPRREYYGVTEVAWNNRINIYKVAGALARYPEDTWTKRIETNIFDLYTNNEEFYNKFLSQFSNIVRNASAPVKETIDQLDTPFTVVANKLPHDKYRYKVYLTPHAMPCDIDVRKNYLTWITGQLDRIKMSDSVKQWFLTCQCNWDRRYLLVEDEDTLLMLKLRDSSAVGQAYKYVIAKK